MRLPLAIIYIVTLAAVIVVVCLGRFRLMWTSFNSRRRGLGTDPSEQKAGEPPVDRASAGTVARKQREPAEIYAIVEPLAHRVKAIVQMLIAVAAVGLVGWNFIYSPPRHDDAIASLLNGIGIGLAAAAVVELAYTLFTAGPDEALDPLMLAVSATILIELGKLRELTIGKAAALLLLGLLLAVLFAARLFLAERHNDDRPKLWWVGKRGGLHSTDSNQAEQDQFEV